MNVKHLAIIMDGNGRWAKAKGKVRTEGHFKGVEVVRDAAIAANDLGVEVLTLYAFSTENWKRPKDEVDNIMNILRDYLKDTENFKDENIRLQFIGERGPLADDIKELMLKAEDDSKDATGLHLNIALNYGGRDEIVHAVRDIVKKGIPFDDITEEVISENLYTAGQPDPDFIIRPSGEYRLSNYLIWQSAYAEYWFSDILWPDFKPRHLEQALDEFSKRNRRFGGV